MLAAASLVAGETDSADQKWKAAVEQKIGAGPTTISTPSEERAQIAKALAEKLGRKSEVQKTEGGYRVVVK